MWGLVAVVAEGGEGVLGVVGRSLNALVLHVLIVGHVGGGVSGKGCCARGGASWFLGLRLVRGQSSVWGGKQCMSVSEAVDKLCPVFFMEGFSKSSS